MPRYAYDRLSAQDNLFLVAESATTPMHVGAVQIIESGPMCSSEGGIDVERFARGLAAQLHRIPRYRQVLCAPGFGARPVWVDDPHFDLAWHLRHSSLPRPGSLEQLKQLAARVMSRALDRARPLWEIWIVEGLAAGEQFALISKIHHCMLDGSAGADLASILMSPRPEVETADPLPYLPRTAPSKSELVRNEVADRARAVARGLVTLRRRERDSERGAALRDRVAAIRELVAYSLRPASPTPLNGPLSPHRRVDWLTMPLDDVRDVKSALGCSVNDLVLATVAGAVRRYLIHRRVDPARIDFRVSAPVNRRPDSQRGQLGNFVSSWIVPLPIGEPDVARRVELLRETTQALKTSRAALGVDSLMSLAEWLPDPVVALAARASAGPVNMIVTNVPGPPFPLYQLGAKMLGTYPFVPCLPGGGLGVALFSYDGRLCWGLNGDPTLVPDLAQFSNAIVQSFEDLRALAASRMTAPRRRVLTAGEVTPIPQPQPRRVRRRANADREGIEVAVPRRVRGLRSAAS
jgi:WS/DGAT/MGAT family acyltransferase